MDRLPRLLPIAVCLVAVLPAGSASAKSPAYPTITKVTPLSLGIGDTLTIQGRNFRAGKARNTVVFKRDGGRPVFIKPGTATTTRITVPIPAKLLTALAQKSGKPVGTRFRLRVLAGRLGKAFTSTKSSPVIGPVARAATGGAVAKDDCDGDGIVNAKDTDDDNDLLPDTLEATLGTNPCKRDSDGDGMSDGWEYYSALDYNGRALPAPAHRPYPNALDGGDAGIDSDGDGLTNAAEYAAWATFGHNALPLNYSGGDPASVGKVKPSPAQAWWDRDKNGFLSDNERDADGDGIPNQDEDGLAPLPPIINVTGFFSSKYLEDKSVRDVVDTVPLYGALDHVHKVLSLDWLSPDSDGDGILDGADDQDLDGISNVDETITELGATDKIQRPINACAPNPDARMCIVGDDDIDHDGIPNRLDTDDDGDLLPDTLELSLGLNPYKADTDGDGVPDGYEYLSAKDLNGAAVPYPGKRPYPNPLDGSDATVDHDGDGLTLFEEYEAWKLSGSAVPLTYSDGLQASGGTALTDDLKDVDGDGLDNYTESHGPLSSSTWWDDWANSESVRCTTQYKESPYPLVTYPGTSFIDADTDGDGILDGADDIDHDGLTNAQESTRRSDWCSAYISVGPGPPHNGTDKLARVNPFNPCKPVYSANCHLHPPFGYYPAGNGYTEDWAGEAP